MSLGTWKLYAANCLLFASGTQFLSAAQSAEQGQRRPPLANRELAAEVRKSLAVVQTQDREGNGIRQGSGFFFKPGLIATNLHVLKRASQGYVKSLSDGVSYKISSVIGFDLKHDICVLKLSEVGGTSLPLSRTDVAVGDDILVAGNPEGLEASFSKGIVSGIRSGSGLIQMDAAISPGSSGGPVVNQRGEVVGLAVSSLIEGQNLNFAVPVRYLREQKLILMAIRAHFDGTEGFGTKGDRDFQEYKVDNSGHLIERTYPHQGTKFVMKYDSLGREVENLEYKQGKLESVTHSTYENSEHGDWIRRHETCWFANSSDDGFTPCTEYYREITYYGEGGG